MLSIVPKQIAGGGLLVVLAVTILFHLLVLMGIVPYEVVWGGRLQTQEQMFAFEAVSITINLVMLTFVAMYVGILKRWVPLAFLKGMFWAMALLFLLNTIGNVFSVNSIEKMVFTPITLLLSVFSLRLALENEMGKEAI